MKWTRLNDYCLSSDAGYLISLCYVRDFATYTATKDSTVIDRQDAPKADGPKRGEALDAVKASCNRHMAGKLEGAA